MNSTTEGFLSAGARLVWKNQRILWWLFSINLMLALFAAAPLSFRLSAILDHSLQADALYRGFDLASFIELLEHPQPGWFSAGIAGAIFAFVYFIFSLFLTGGILEQYRYEGKLSMGEFFHACGAFFWRLVRLTIVLMIVLAPTLALNSGIGKWADKLAADSSIEKLGFWVEVMSGMVVVLLMMAVRLWFDMAQVRTIVENEPAIRRSVRRAFPITFGNFGQLFWIYLRITLVSWLALAIAAWIWIRIPHSSAGASFFLWQFVLLIWLATRLWQRASEMSWYQRTQVRAPVLAAAPVLIEAPPESHPEVVPPDVPDPGAAPA